MGLIVKELIKIGQNRLETAGCADAKLDSQLLFTHMMNIDRMGFFMLQPEMLGDELCEQYFALVEARASGVPLQHITGTQEFMGITFAVDENVLIPRQDTETLVEEAIKILRTKGKKHQKVLDLCTGSGAIAISLERYLNTTLYSEEKPIAIDVTASDISTKALKIAKENATQNHAKIKIVEGNLFEPFRGRRSCKTFDMIVSNPPYIKSDVISTLQREVKDHEPMLALDGGEDGLDYYRQIIAQAQDFLTKDGTLLLEIGHDQAVDIEKLAGYAGYASMEVIKDLAGHDRVVILYKS